MRNYPQEAERPTYRTWRSMIARCTQPSCEGYHKYGGRGISVCDRWRVFARFLEDMGLRPEGRTLDRINNDGNYEPGNCRWATVEEQCNNTRRSVRVTWRGETHTIGEWAKITGLHNDTIRDRLLNGATPELALSKPVGFFNSACYRGHVVKQIHRGPRGRFCEECERGSSRPGEPQP